MIEKLIRQYSFHTREGIKEKPTPVFCSCNKEYWSCNGSDDVTQFAIIYNKLFGNSNAKKIGVKEKSESTFKHQYRKNFDSGQFPLSTQLIKPKFLYLVKRCDGNKISPRVYYKSGHTRLWML